MKSAKKLYEISKEQSSQLVKSVLNGVKERAIERCEEEANKGFTYYSIYLHQTFGFAKELLLNKCIELIKEFENNGYQISIDDSGNGYYINFIITFSWDGNIHKNKDKHFDIYEHLYDTEHGIIQEV
jgi:hypothetical protein